MPGNPPAPLPLPPPAYGAAMPSRIVTADLTISPFADIMRWAPDMRNPRSVAMLQ